MNRVRGFCLVLSLAIAGLIGGCAQPPPQPLSYQEATPIVESSPLITPRASNRYQLSYGSNPALLKAFKHYLKTGHAANITTEGFIQVAYNNGQQPVIATSPFQQTVISLESGERWTNISSGDPSRWSYSVAYSGVGANQQANVLIKPSFPSISTNMVITTDRRVYNLKLVSTQDDHYVRDVRFWYPEEMVNAANSQRMQEAGTVLVPNVSLADLNFNYRIDGGRRPPSWMPLRAFDDGKQTFIQFPLRVYPRDLPALFVVNNNRAPELVNYRFKPPYFVVDKLFGQAILIAGVGSRQTRVVITN